MGEHKGWTVRRDKRSGRFRGMVWLPSKSAYKTETHDTEKLAKDWAKGEAAKIARGEAVATGARVADLRDDYTDSLRARGRSDSHLANIKHTLDALEKTAPDLGDKSAPAAIERWLDGAEVAPATRNRYLVEVRALVGWAMRRDRLTKDPTRAIERATVPNALKPQFSLAEIVSLLALPTPDPAMHRRVAIMTLAGLRSDEAAALRWEDIDLAGGVILVRFREGYRLKRGRERVVPLQPLLRSLLGPAGASDEQVAPLTDNNLRRLFPHYLTACDVPVEGRTAHSCRHGYAGMMTATGVPGPLLSAYMGHTAAGTTMIYTKLAARYVSAAADWPRGELRLACLASTTSTQP